MQQFARRSDRPWADRPTPDCSLSTGGYLLGLLLAGLSLNLATAQEPVIGTPAGQPPAIVPRPALTPLVAPQPAVPATEPVLPQASSEAPLVSPLATPAQPAVMLEADETEAAAWAPKLRIMLTLKSNSPKPLTPTGVRYFSPGNTASVPQPGPQPGPQLGPQPALNPVNIQPAVAAVRPTFATLACDDISMATAAGEETVEYTFVAGSRCRLLLADLQIDGDSMKLENGVLTITNATTTTKDKTKLHAEQMTIPLKLLAINTAMFGQPVSQLAAAAPVVMQRKPTLPAANDGEREFTRDFQHSFTPR